jgi:hypothetical protein
VYAGHVAAGLALRGRARTVPVAVFVIGAFVLDLLWITFGTLHIDRTPWDSWSHSLVMATVWAAAFAALFWRYGRIAFLALWLAVFSHYILDLIVQGASLYPDQPRGEVIPVLVSAYARPLQLGLCILLLLVFVHDERSAGVMSWRIWAVCGLVLALNARFLLGV